MQAKHSSDVRLAELTAALSIATDLGMGQPINYAIWHDLFTQGWMRVATLLFAASLAWHAWVGVRDIIMDYIKPTGLRLSLEAVVLLTIAGYVAWAIQILWR